MLFIDIIVLSNHKRKENMTEKQRSIVTDLTRDSKHRVLFIKNGHAFLVSPVGSPDSLLRVSPEGEVKELAL